MRLYYRCISFKKKLNFGPTGENLVQLAMMGKDKFWFEDIAIDLYGQMMKNSLLL